VLGRLRLERVTRAALEVLGLDVEVEKVTDYPTAAEVRELLSAVSTP